MSAPLYTCDCDHNCGLGCLGNCKGCGGSTGRPSALSKGIIPNPNGPGTILNWPILDQRQKQIQGVVRVPASEYAMNKAALNVYEDYYDAYKNGGIIPWNQSSDRFYPSGSKKGDNINVATRGNSTLRSITRLRPNASSAPSNSRAQGVDIKHNSYARYLNKLKGRGPLRGQNVPPSIRPVALQGAKNNKFSIVSCRPIRYTSA